MRRALSVLAAVVVLTACPKDRRPQVVVRVETDYSEAELSHYRITVSGSEGSDTRGPLLRTDPFSFGVAPRGGDPKRVVEVSVEGLFEETVIARTTRRFEGFRDDDDREIEIFLARRCAGAPSCPEETACGRSCCRSIAILPEEDGAERCESGDAGVEGRDAGLGPLAIALGGAENDEVVAVGIDSAGNLYAAGNFRGTMALSATVSFTASEQDAYLVSYDPSGRFRWGHRLGGPENVPQEVRALTVDPSDRIWIIGSYVGILTVGGRSLSSVGRSYEGFVLAFDRSGAIVLDRTIGSDAPDRLSAIAVEGDRVIVGGTHQDPLSIDACVLEERPPNPPQDAFVASLARSDLSCVWAKAIASSGADEVGGIATRDDRVIVSGSYQGELEVIGEASRLPAASTGVDLFLLELSADGALRRASGVGSELADAARAVRFAPGDELWVAASIGRGTLRAVSSATTAIDTLAIGPVDLPLAVVFESSGLRFVRLLQAVGSSPSTTMQVFGIDVGTPVAAGGFDGTLVKPNGDTVTSSAGDGVLLFLDRGAVTDAERLGGAGTDQIRAILRDPVHGRLVIGGLFSGEIELYGERLRASGGTDGFLTVRPD